MYTHMKRSTLLVLALVVLAASAWAAPNNIILMIGDGMGLAHVAAARIASNGPDGRLAIDTMPVTGLVCTHSANAVVTDSAASGTALASGTKTNNGMLSMTPDGTRVKTILEAARGIAKSTGLVTTTSICDATPAAFASHVLNRGQHPEIAGQLLASRVDILLGGGRSSFIPKTEEGSNRSDERNLMTEASARGYAVVTTAEEFAGTKSDKILGLFAKGALTTREPEPPLSDLAKKAIDVLSKNKDGFFLMVEGGQIDIYAHGNDGEGMIRQLLEFDKAVAHALDFAKRDGNTLVIVTADHETGGLTLLDEEGKIKHSWSTRGHSGSPVPLYAFGPGSERFSGILDNTDVSRGMASLWRVSIGTTKTSAIPSLLAATIQ